MSESDDVAVRYEEREVVALFGGEGELNAAVDALLKIGVSREDLSALTAPPASGPQSAGAQADSPDTPREAYKAPEERSEGVSALVAAPVYALGAGAVAAAATAGAALAPVIAVAAGGVAAGGAVGLLLARLVGRRHARDVEMQLASGGLVLWVHNPDPARDAAIIGALKANGARDVHVHVAQRTWGRKDSPLSTFNPDPLLGKG
ncbi:hypothetical protein ACFFJB_06630 [Camelimonas abortus]|uniref:Uncharacterized protein n=1 Tax=Camelimonas abortus TaxID=1017184 RepID=A0ABV7LGC6_9HYPH